jgi:TonB-linked SusC/RagA family outer membrane protein
MSLQDLLDVDKVQAGLHFYVPPGLFDRTLRFNMDIHNEDALTITAAYLGRQGFRYKIFEKGYVVERLPMDLVSDSLVARSISIMEIVGQVSGEKEEWLAGANIWIKRNKEAVVTNMKGIFRFRTGQVRYMDTICISYTGYEQGEYPVTDTDLMIIRLNILPGELDASKVTAYGTTTQRSSTANTSTIKGEDIASQPVTNPLAAMEGRAAGLVITQLSGVPGAGYKVSIRGENSIRWGTDPFFVVDGVPYAPNNSSISNIPSGGAAGLLSPFNIINPNDIESIEILKDADATAIYGSRGANGVIIITTKKGVIGRPAVTLDISSGFSRITSRLKTMNTRQFVKMRTEGFANDSVKPDMNNAPDLTLLDTNRSTDYAKMLTGGTAFVTNVQASVSGGDTNTRYLVSGGYHVETSIFPKNLDYKRGTLQASLYHSTPDSTFAIQFSGMLGIDQNNQFINDLSAYQLLDPNAPKNLRNPDGSLVWQTNGVPFTNPLSFSDDRYQAAALNALLNLRFDYHFSSHLTGRFGMGYSRLANTEKSFIPIAAQDPALSPVGSSFTGNINFRSWIVEPQMEYTGTIGGGSLTLLVGGTLQAQRNTGATLAAKGFTSDALLTVYGAAPHIEVGNSMTDYHYNAFFGRLNYKWKRTYILNLSGRRDGSSRFGPSKQFGNFGAAGMAWLFSKEKFMDSLRFLSFGKLRASYGITGNDQIGDYQYVETWSGTTTQPYQGMTGFFPTSLSNPNLAWELIRKLELGVELGFIHDKIFLTASWYRNRSANQLVPYALPSQAGFNSVMKNLPAVVQNTGVELTLRSKNNSSKNFEWTTDIQLTIPDNKLISFPDLVGSSYAQDLVVGKSLHILKAFRYNGVNNVSGVFSFDDLNNGRVVVGKRDLTCFGGISNSFRYHQFHLDIFIEGRQQTGTDWVNAIYATNIPGMAGPGLYSNQPVEVLDRWTTPGDHAKYQRYTTSSASDAAYAVSGYTASSAALKDASFLRLKNIALSWNFPDSLLHKHSLKGAKIYIQAQNLFTISSYKGADPETQTVLSLPPLKTITFGIQLTFK